MTLVLVVELPECLLVADTVLPLFLAPSVAHVSAGRVPPGAGWEKSNTSVLPLGSQVGSGEGGRESPEH